jgi:hypothetical protein
VLSPQFLLWLLPVSACAYGLGRENLVLLLAILFTQIELQHYDGVESMSGSFVWPLAVRNVLLLVYLALVAAPILRTQGSRGRAGRYSSPATRETPVDSLPGSPKTALRTA